MRLADWIAVAALAAGASATIAPGGDRSRMQAPPDGVGYARIARLSLGSGEGPVLIGDEVLLSKHQRAGADVRLLGPDGTLRRVLEVPNAGFSSMTLDASHQAIAVITATLVATSAGSGSEVSSAFGPPAGPLEPFPFEPSDVAVAGPLVVATEYDRPDRLVVWDVRTPGAGPRVIAAPGARLFTGAAGHYVAVIAGAFPHLRIVVHDLRDGREVYSVPARGLKEDAIGPDGRVVLLERARGGTRVVTATPAEPVRREIARLPLRKPRLAVSGSGVAVVRAVPGGLAQVVLVGYDGSQRAVTPALGGIHALDFDGERLAFTAGRCVFAGRVPGTPPAAAPRDPCFVAPAQQDFARLQRFAQEHGSRLRVPLTCVAPENNGCTVHLRLSGPGFTVHRRARLAPGRHVVKVPIPAGRRRAAWRKGMSIATIERGHESSGAAIPQ